MDTVLTPEEGSLKAMKDHGEESALPGLLSARRPLLGAHNTTSRDQARAEEWALIQHSLRKATRKRGGVNMRTAMTFRRRT
jgi:hypothetical protein